MSPSPSRHPDPRPTTLPLALLALIALVLLLLPASPAAAQDPAGDHGQAPPASLGEPMDEHEGAAALRARSTRPETRRAERVRRNGRCTSDCHCEPGELCSPETARCETAFCPQIFRPVCGLDGKTYPNRCRARAEHVVVAHEGECRDGDGGAGSGEIGRPCGGIAGIRCPEGQVCDLPAGECDARDLQGTCVDRPDFCTEQYDPVCGCDGKTYSNDCHRLRAGVQKAHDGECRDGGDGGDGPGQRPDFCDSNDDCPARAYCQYPGRSCEGRGRCAPRPDVCTKEYDPVCGCDGRTYGNACTAAANGVSVARKGRCDER